MHVCVNNDRDLSMTVHEKGDSHVGLRTMSEWVSCSLEKFDILSKISGRTAVSLQLKREEGLVAQNDYGSTN